jgi:hypothetical protein
MESHTLQEERAKECWSVLETFEGAKSCTKSSLEGAGAEVDLDGYKVLKDATAAGVPTIFAMRSSFFAFAGADTEALVRISLSSATLRDLSLASIVEEGKEVGMNMIIVLN